MKTHYQAYIIYAYVWTYLHRTHTYAACYPICRYTHKQIDRWATYVRTYIIYHISHVIHHIYIYIYSCCISIYMHTYTKYIYICIHIRIHIYIYVYVHIYICICICNTRLSEVRPLSQYCAQAPSRNDHEQIQPVPIPLRTNQIAPSACDQLAGSENVKMGAYSLP